RRRGDRADRLLAVRRDDVFGEARWPFLGVLFVGPFSRMGGCVTVGTLLEADGFGGRGGLGCARGVALFYWIGTVEKHLSTLAGALACFHQGERVQRAQPHLAGATAERVPEDPRSVAALFVGRGRDLQPQALTVAKQAGLGAPQIGAGQSIDSACHDFRPTLIPTFGGWIMVDKWRTCQDAQAKKCPFLLDYCRRWRTIGDGTTR